MISPSVTARPHADEDTGDRTDSAYSRLRDLIVRGQLAPGSRIIETEAADRLDVSRTPVRAGLQRLEHEGFVESGKQNGGQSRPVVAPLTKRDAGELLFLLGGLEELAARRLVELPDEERDAIVADLRSLNARMREEVDAERPLRQNVLDLDAGFHRTYVEGSAGSRLRKLHASYWPQAERYFRLYATTRPYSLDRSVAEHEAMIEAVASGEPERAAEAVKQNWRSARERLQRAIDVAGERGSW